VSPWPRTRFPDPPPDVPLDIARSPDQVAITIKPGPTVAGAVLSHSDTHMPPGFRWIYKVMFIGGFAGLVLLIPMCVAMGAYATDRVVRVFAYGFAAYSVGMAALAFRVMRRGSLAPLIFADGTFPWRFELSRHRWRTAYRKPLFGEHAYPIDPARLQRLYVDDQNRVIAYEGDRMMILTPSLLPEMATWLRDALHGQLDRDAHQAVSNDQLCS
jgi:hypothetical protein